MHIQILELGTVKTMERKFKSNGLYICCIILYMHIEILELGTLGTQIVGNGFYMVYPTIY